MRTIIEPFRIRTVEPIHFTTPEERAQRLAAAHWNVFGLRARDVMIDMLTDSGTGAMSTQQWAAMMRGDESYAGSDSFYELKEVIQDLTGYRHVFPVHQGRAAERIVFQILGGRGKTIPNNTHFDTTRANIEFTGAEASDLPVPEAHEPGLERPFKGDMDLDALAGMLAAAEPGTVPVGLLTITNNSVGGQGVSMANIRAVSGLYRSHGIPFLLDAARFAENAFLIKRNEAGYGDKPLKEITREMFSHADGCMVSAKKDGLVNIGGFAAVNDDDLADQIRNPADPHRGFPNLRRPGGPGHGGPGPGSAGGARRALPGVPPGQLHLPGGCAAAARGPHRAAGGDSRRVCGRRGVLGSHPRPPNARPEPLQRALPCRRDPGGRGGHADVRGHRPRHRRGDSHARWTWCGSPCPGGSTPRATSTG